MVELGAVDSFLDAPSQVWRGPPLSFVASDLQLRLVPPEIFSRNYLSEAKHKTLPRKTNTTLRVSESVSLAGAEWRTSSGYILPIKSDRADSRRGDI